MNNPSRIAYVPIRICGLFGLIIKIAIARINPPIPPPIMISIPSAGFCDTALKENIAPIDTKANNVRVLFTVPSSVILSVVAPPWNKWGASAGLLLR